MNRADFFKLKAFVCNPLEVLKRRHLEEGGRVQKFIDTESLRLSNEKAPFDQHNLIESSENHTKYGSGQLEYPGPYSRKLYYHPEYNFSTEHNAEAGGYWFERMKQQHKDQILKGARKIANGE